MQHRGAYGCVCIHLQMAKRIQTCTPLWTSILVLVNSPLFWPEFTLCHNWCWHMCGVSWYTDHLKGYHWGHFPTIVKSSGLCCGQALEQYCTVPLVSDVMRQQRTSCHLCLSQHLANTHVHIRTHCVPCSLLISEPPLYITPSGLTLYCNICFQAVSFSAELHMYV